MLEELDALAAKLAELAGQMRNLRTENQELRSQLADSNVELGILRGRVSGATQRIDAMLGRLPAGSVEPESATRV
jgi:regulator of replication initiation timing